MPRNVFLFTPAYCSLNKSRSFLYSYAFTFLSFLKSLSSMPVMISGSLMVAKTLLSLVSYSINFWWAYCRSFTCWPSL